MRVTFLPCAAPAVPMVLLPEAVPCPDVVPFPGAVPVADVRAADACRPSGPGIGAVREAARAAAEVFGFRVERSPPEAVPARGQAALKPSLITFVPAATIRSPSMPTISTGTSAGAVAPSFTSVPSGR